MSSLRDAHGTHPNTHLPKMRHETGEDAVNRAPEVAARKSRGWTDATVRGVSDYLSCSDPECSCCHPDDAMLARLQAAAKSSPHSKGLERYWRKRIGNEAGKS